MSRKANLFRGIALGLAAWALMWFSSLWLYDAHKTRQALEWRQAVLSGDTPYRWPFDSRREVRSGHGVEHFDWASGELRGAWDDPYVYLDLEGRIIDARRYSVLFIRLYSDSENRLQLFHHQGDESEIHFSKPLPVHAGWQELELDLQQLAWQTRNVYRAGDKARPSRWGSKQGTVSGLRIDPVLEGEFALDLVELRDPRQGSVPDQGIVVFHSRNDPVLNGLDRDSPDVPILAQDRWLRTPETASAMRRAIAERLPSAILFPTPPRQTDGRESGQGGRLKPGSVAGIAFTAALLLFVIRARKTGAAGDRLALSAYLAMVISCLFLEPHLPGAFKLLPLAPLAVATWLLRPEAGQVGWRGDPRAWLYLAPLMALSLALMITLYQRGPEDSPLWQVLATYLGWALLQQFLVAAVVFGQFRQLCDRYAVVLASAAFGFMHLPNFALMSGTFLLGFLLLSIQRRHPNLPALAVTHALAAVSVNLAAPGWLLLSREVGPRFLQNL